MRGFRQKERFRQSFSTCRSSLQKAKERWVYASSQEMRIRQRGLTFIHSPVNHDFQTNKKMQLPQKHAFLLSIKFLSATGLPHGQFWVTAKEAESLTRYYSLRF